MKYFLSIFVFTVMLSAAVVIASADSLTVYPEYPDMVTRNTDYTVTVSQGNRTETIPVYSMCRQTGSQVKDNYRRFSEFAFEGVVTVHITSEKFDLSMAQVMPESAAKNASYADGILTLELTKNGNIAVNVSKDYRTTLGIFAESPEIDIPDRNSSNVLYYGAGYHDTDGVLTLSAGKTLYMEPGAVLDANIRIKGDGVTIRGRGIIRDKLYGSAAVLTPVVKINDNVKNINIEGIKFLDSKTFVLVGNSGNSNVVVDNLKILSNKANSDAVSFWHSPSEVTVKNSYIFNADNVFIFSGNCHNMVYQDCIVGTAGALMACSKELLGSLTLRNIDVFAANIPEHSNMALVINNAYSTDVAENCTYTVNSVVLENIDVSYCKRIPQLFSGNGLGEGIKTFVFRNVFLPDEVKTGIRILSGGNYQIDLEDVWFGSVCVNSESSAKIVDNGDGMSQITFKRKNTDIRIFVNNYLLRTDGLVCEQNGDVIVPCSRILLPLGAMMHWDENSSTLTVIKDDKAVWMSQGSSIAYVNGTAVQMPVSMQEMENGPGIPLGFLCDVWGADVNYDADTKVMTITGNKFLPWIEEAAAQPKPLGTELLDNPDFELQLDNTGIYGYGWEAHNDSIITRITDAETAQSGNSYVKISNRKHGYSGLRQMITSQLAANGPGKYKISMYVRAADSNSEIVGKPFHMTLGILTDEMPDEKTYPTFYTMTDNWQKIENEFTVSWNGELTMARLVAVGTGNYKDDFLIDKFSMTKVRTGFVLNADKSSVSVNIQEHEEPLKLSIILVALQNGMIQKTQIIPHTFEVGENQCSVSMAPFNSVAADEIRCFMWKWDNLKPLCPMEIITEW